MRSGAAEDSPAGWRNEEKDLGSAATGVPVYGQGWQRAEKAVKIRERLRTVGTWAKRLSISPAGITTSVVLYSPGQELPFRQAGKESDACRDL